MNATCNGDWITNLGLYRCLNDGTWLKLKKQPTVCGHCKRVVVAQVRRARVRFKVASTLQVRIPRWGWLDFNTKSRTKKAKKKDLYL